MKRAAPLLLALALGGCVGWAAPPLPASEWGTAKRGPAPWPKDTPGSLEARRQLREAGVLRDWLHCRTPTGWCW